MPVIEDEVSGIPSVEKQREWLEKAEKDPKNSESNRWWILNKSWFQSYKTYLGDEISPPGSISNDDLAVEKDSPAGAPQLRADAEKDKDFVVLPESIWSQLEKWYGVLESTPTFLWEALTERAIGIGMTNFEVHLCEDSGKPSEASHLLENIPGHYILGKLATAATAFVADMFPDTDIRADDGKGTARLWFSNDGENWTLLTDDKLESIGMVQRLVADSEKRLLMVEGRKSDGFWRRVDQQKVDMVEAMKESVATAEKRSDDEWRAQLEVGDYLDHYDTRDEENTKWRESVVVGKKGDKILVKWRGMLEPSFEVDRQSEAIAKPYSNSRDWRNQLRTNTKIEVLRKYHPNEIIRQRNPAYENEAGDRILYFDGNSGEWWIADIAEWVKFKESPRGFLHLDCNEPNPNLLNEKADKEWQVYHHTWSADSDVRVATCEDAGTIPGQPELPDRIRIEGHDGPHKNLMGVYTWKPRPQYFRATVKRIDRKVGEIDLAVKTSNNSSYYSYWPSEETVQDVSLYGDDICEVGTYTVETKYKSEWMASIENDNGDDVQKGVVGLKNLGNTCFMNSMLQCLNCALPLTNYFLTGRYDSEINTKNALGTGGVLAKSYASLVQEMWDGRYKVVGPSPFKDALGRFAPQFAGYQQQDSMELYQFLLDNLHEDLNRVINKPYVEDVEDKGRPDLEVAEEAWEAYLKRNDSVIVDLMMGQYRSHLTCPKCSHEARKFDPYMSVALPVPGNSSTDITITLHRKNSQGPGIKFDLKVPKNSMWPQVAEVLASKVPGLSMQSLGIYEVWGGKCQRTYYTPMEKSPTRIYGGRTSIDDYFAFEVFDDQEVTELFARAKDEKAEAEDSVSSYHSNQGVVNPPLKTVAMQVRISFRKKRNTYWDHDVRPAVLPVHSKITNAEVYKLIHNYISPYLLTPPPPPPPEDDNKASSADTDVTMNEKDEEDENKPAENKPDETEEASNNDVAIENKNNDEMNEVNDENKQPLIKETEEAKNNEVEEEAVAADAQPALPYRLFPLDATGRPSQDYKNQEWSSSRPEEDYYIPLNDDDQPFDWSEYPGGVMVIVPSAGHFDSDTYGATETYVEPKSETAENDLALEKRFVQFSEREQLGENDTWYCPKCKDHVQAYKKMDIWSVPNLLTIHLKRFQYEASSSIYATTRVMRDKIETPVEFPMELNMSPHVIGPQKDEDDLVYELYGVSNHIGNLGGGHYTAYGLHGKNWFLFNDSRLEPANEADLQSSEAYVLFYRRKSSAAKGESDNDGGGEASPSPAN